MRRSRRNVRYALTAILICAALALMIYPFISNWIYENSADSVVASLEAAAESADDKEYAEEIEAAHEYNEKLETVKVQLTDPFNKELVENSGLEYSSLLCMSDDGIMGYITIPSINIEIPIYHGTSETVLEKGAGHLEGTSLPVGGKSTHCVLTGHTGLSKAKMFTDISHLKNGDIFILNIMGEKLAYEVDQVKTVLPDELADLYIESGKDYCTLVTCTPYGINSHRLLVRGERVDYEETIMDKSNFEIKEEDSSWMNEYREALMISLVILAALLSLTFIYRLHKRKN